MNTEKITIAGRTFDVPNRYSAGHTVDEAEASALNQVFHENVRNNLAKRLPEDDDEAQDLVSQYAEGYVFGQRTGGGGGTRDPVKAEALRIAKETVKKAIQKKGYKLDQFTAKDITERATRELDRHPEWMEMAKRRVDEQRSVASELLDDIEVETATAA